MLCAFFPYFITSKKGLNLIYVHSQNNTIVINGSPGAIVRRAGAKHPLVYSFNLPGADGELTGHLIQSERCQLARSERARTSLFPPVWVCVSSAEC